MNIGGNSLSGKALTERVGALLPIIVGHHHGSNHESTIHKLAAQAEHIFIIGDSQVAAHLILFDVFGADDDDDFRLILQLGKHPQLAVRLKAGEHSAGVIVVKELAAKLQIEFITKLRNALADVF